MSVGSASWRGTELHLRIVESMRDYARILGEQYQRQLDHAEKVVFPASFDLSIATQMYGNIGAKHPITRRELNQFIRQEDKMIKIWETAVPLVHPPGSHDKHGNNVAGQPIIDEKTGLPIPHPTHRHGRRIVIPQFRKLQKYASVLLPRSFRGQERSWLRKGTGPDPELDVAQGKDQAIGDDWARGRGSP